MICELSYFENLYDNVPKRMEFDTFGRFKELLYTVATKPGAKYKRGMKAGTYSPLISPAVYRDGTTRKNDNVSYWRAWCCIDIDEHTVSPLYGSLKDELASLLSGLEYVVYSTASSRVGAPRFRIVFPTVCTIPADKVNAFWHALNKEIVALGLGCDEQTKDKSRMYYVPAQYKDADNFIFGCEHPGAAIDPYELIARYPYAEKRSTNLVDNLPPAIRDAIMKEKMSRLNNYDVNWVGYRDCPFWPSNLEKEYHSISKSGWYGCTYRIMTALAGRAVAQGYPITAKQIEVLFRQFDRDHGNWYKQRPIHTEAERALNFVLKNSL